MKVRYKKSFLKDIKKLKNQSLQQRLEVVLIQLETVESLMELSGVTSLSGVKEYFRIRIGTYRLGLKLELDGSLSVVRFLKRGEIYRYFP